MIIDFIRGNGGGGTGSTTVIDNLQSTSTTAALSANQGRVLNEIKADTTAVTESLKAAQKTWTATTVSDMNALTGISEGDVCVVASAGTTHDFVEDQAMYDYLTTATTSEYGLCGIYQGLYEIYGNQASGWTRMRVTTVENPYYNAAASFDDDAFGMINFSISGIENEPEYDPSGGGIFGFDYYQPDNQFSYYTESQEFISTGVTQIYDLISPGVSPIIAGNVDEIMEEGRQLVLHPSNQKLTVAFKIEFYKEVALAKTFQYNNGSWVELASKSYVDSAVSGKVDTSALTAYTPTTGFATINGSGITNGGNIVIESGGTDPDAQHRFTASTIADMNAITGISEGDVCVVASGGTTHEFVEDQAMNDFLSSATTGGIYQGLYEIYGNQASGWTKMRVTTVENPYYNAGSTFTADTSGAINFTISGIENEPEYDPSWGGNFAFDYSYSLNDFAYYNGAQPYISTGVTQIFDLVSPGVAPSVSGNVDAINNQGNQLVLNPANEKLTVAFKIEFYKEISVPKTFQYNNGNWVELATKGDLTSYTPTANFATINGSGITNGGDITIEAGSDFVPMITTLPASPENGAVYNYNGTLIKYVNGPGNWGEWVGFEFGTGTASADFRNSAFLYYSVIPSSMDGTKLCVLGNTSRLYLYFNLTDNSIDAFAEDSNTGTPYARVYKNAVSETLLYREAQTKYYIGWVDNVIQLRPDASSAKLSSGCTVSASTAHYELLNTPDRVAFNRNNISNVGPEYSYLVNVDKKGRVDGVSFEVARKHIRFNSMNDVGKNVAFLKTPGGNSAPAQIFAPESSGASGTLCVSQGNAAPQWQTVTQALGVDFWVGTEAQYEALAPNYSNTTLYFIKDE